MAVKVPPLLHKMSLASQKAWYKKQGMEMPTTAVVGKSAAQAKKDVGEINKKKAREAAIAAAAATSKKNKELVKSSERVRAMRQNADMFGGGLGGGLDRNRDIISHVRSGGYIKAGRLGEENMNEAKPDASMAMTDTLKNKMISDKDKQTLGKVADLMRSMRNKDKKNAYVRGLGLKAMKAGDVDPARGHSPTRFGREVLAKEETESVDEMRAMYNRRSNYPGARLQRDNQRNLPKRQETPQEKEDRLSALATGPKAGRWAHGGKYEEVEVTKKNEPPFTPDKKVVRRGPGGPMSHAKWLAKQAMMKKMKKEEVELTEAPKDDREYGYEGDMAMSQLKSILMNAQKLHDMLEPNTDLPEWVQSKITLAEDYIVTATNYCAGEMKEEVEQVDEKINLVTAKMGDVIKDFQKSDAPQFKGKSQEKRREMAVAAKLGAEREAKNEEVEQVEEKYMGFAKLKASIAAKGGARNPAAVAAAIGRKKYGKEKFQAMAAAGKKKTNEETEVVAEAEGKLAVTPKEKELAAHHGDKSRITFGDVLKARLKSAAEKAMKKGN